MTSRPSFALLATLVAAPMVLAQPSTGDYAWYPYTYVSRTFTNRGDQLRTMDTHQVFVPGAASLRLVFGNVVLGAQDFIEVTSDFDGHAQRLTPVELGKWQDTSAYFNGEVLWVKLVVASGSSASYEINNLMVGLGGYGMFGTRSTICGPTDDRVLSQDWRAMRAVSNPNGTGGGCTIWAADPVDCVLSAGHCTSTFGVAEAEVPLSTGSGAAQHPAPNRQWPIVQTFGSLNGGVGSDFAVARLASNAQGQFPAQLYGWFDLGYFVPNVGETIRITGYGSVSSSLAPLSWNAVNKTHTGPFVSGGTTSGLRYAVDTTGGNSGSPVIHEATGLAIGIHTHAGCTTSGGSNQGTSLTRPDFMTLLAASCTTIPPFSLDVTSTGGSLFVEMTMMPTGTARGFTLLSLDTTRPAGQGALFGLHPDFLTLQVLALPPAHGSLFHWMLPSTAFPAVPLTLPAGTLSALAGVTFDVQGVALDGSQQVLDATNVIRITL